LLTCEETKDRSLYLVNPPSKTEITPTEEETKRTAVLECVKRGKTQPQCITEVFGPGVNSDSFYRCTCQENLSGVTCVIGGIAGMPCPKVCKLNKTAFMNVVTGQTVKPFSPLQFIKVLSNFLFYAAIVIFILNFISAGFDYVRSGGQPDALKTAQAKITNSIGGLVFILLVGALLNYLITILIGAGFQA
jgi:hypothetical protein